MAEYNWPEPSVKTDTGRSPARAAAYVALYPMLLDIAQQHGYALAVHGSLHRDFDLVAIPWQEEASEPLVLIQAIKEATRAVTHHEAYDDLIPDCSPRQKPHGRVAYSLHVTNTGMYGGYLDISVMSKRGEAKMHSADLLSRIQQIEALIVKQRDILREFDQVRDIAEERQRVKSAVEKLATVCTVLYRAVNENSEAGHIT